MGLMRKTLVRDIIGKGPVALAHINFFISLSVASITTVWVLFINSFVDNPSTTGFISAFLSLISFLSYFAFIPLLNRNDKRELFAFSLILFSIFYTVMSFASSLPIVIILASSITILHTVRSSSFGVMLRNNSSDKELAEKEGLNWTFSNIGWVVGPIFGGYIAQHFGLRPVFLIASFLSLVAFMTFIFTPFRREKYPKKRKLNIFLNFKELFKDKRRFLAYLLTGGTSMWWMIIYVYAPLYMVSLGFRTESVGYVMLGAALPLILLEHGFSKLVNKVGFRRMFILGFSIPAILVLIAFFLDSVYIQLSLLLFSSIGLAMLEPNTEAYFLKVIRRDEVARFFGPYSTSRDLLQIVAKTIPAIILLFLPFKYVFLSFFVFMFCMVLIAFFVKD